MPLSSASSPLQTSATGLKERLLSRADRLDAMRATCQGLMHRRGRIVCPQCQRDEKDAALLREAAAALPDPPEYDALLVQAAAHRGKPHDVDAWAKQIAEDMNALPDPLLDLRCIRCGKPRLSGNHKEGWVPGSGVFWHEFQPEPLLESLSVEEKKER